MQTGWVLRSPGGNRTGSGEADPGGGQSAPLKRAPVQNENPGRLITPAGTLPEGDGSSELTIALVRLSRVRGPSSLRGVDLGSPRKEPFLVGKSSRIH